jgi:hypothetical protein
VFVAPRPIERTVEVTDPNTVSAMVASSSKSRIDDGTEGPFILAAGIDASRIENGPEGTPAIIRTRIGVVGSPGVASNRLIELFGNRDLSTGLVQWVAQEDDVISASRALGGVRKIVLTQARRNHLVRSAIVFPALAALLPLPVAIVRLRRG